MNYPTSLVIVLSMIVPIGAFWNSLRSPFKKKREFPRFFTMSTTKCGLEYFIINLLKLNYVPGVTKMFTCKAH